MFIDESIGGSEPNTVSLRRDIAILDENDNRPVFHDRPYAATIPESAKIGDYLLPSGRIVVTDQDGGVNADIKIECLPDGPRDDACNVFNISAVKVR